MDPSTISCAYNHCKGWSISILCRNFWDKYKQWNGNPIGMEHWTGLLNRFIFLFWTSFCVYFRKSQAFLILTNRWLLWMILVMTKVVYCMQCLQQCINLKLLYSYLVIIAVSYMCKLRLQLMQCVGLFDQF